VNKKLIIMIAAAGLISFAGAFAFSWFNKAPTPSQNPKPNEQVSAGREIEPALRQLPAAGSSIAMADSKMKRNLTEKQLSDLIYQVRDKIQEYTDKLQTLELREQRLQMTQNMLKKDIEELNKLRVELSSIVARLKEQRDMLENSRVKIAEAEKNNLLSIAATYDKMDAASAGKILTNMSQTQNGQGSGFDDAVKILHFMAERTKAKLLAELAVSDPKLAWDFCQRLKQIIEE
jgi:seryl-tRNA synthetase